MLYILILLIPFALFIVFLVYQNAKLSKEYVSDYQRIWEMKAVASDKMTNKSLKDLDALITDDSIKELEQDISLLEDSYGLSKSSVISNTFTPKKKKMQILNKRIQKLESKVNESQNA